MILEGGGDLHCDFFEVETSHVSLKYRSIMITTSWLPFVVCCNGLSMFMIMNQSRVLAGKSSKCGLHVPFARLHADSW